MESTKPISGKQEDEILLKDLILKMQQWIKYLWGKWLVILIGGVVCAGLGFSYALTKKTHYVAELTFVVEDTKSTPFAAYAGLASQFGIDLGGNSGSGVFSGDNILKFLKSRLIVEKALMSPIVYQGKTQSLAEYYIEINEIRKSWKDNPLLQNLRFPANLPRARFSREQDSVLNTIYKTLANNNLDVTKPDKKLSFISVECSTKDEIFSKAFTERVVREAIDFYVQTKTQRSKAAVESLQSRADSLESLLNRKTYSVAASMDMNLNPARSMAGVNTELAARDKMVLQTMYAEVEKNLELSKMAMAQETPIIQIIDTPILPLKKEKLGKLKALILGGFLGGFLVILLLLIRRVYREIMTK